MAYPIHSRFLRSGRIREKYWQWQAPSAPCGSVQAYLREFFAALFRRNQVVAMQAAEFSGLGDPRNYGAGKIIVMGEYVLANEEMTWTGENRHLPRPVELSGVIYAAI